MATGGGAATTAIVHAADGVRFVVTASCPELLLARLGEYVRKRCDDVLWADASSQVRTSLDDGDVQEAIALYFARTGERWDQERLDLVTENGERSTPNELRMADARR